MDKATTLFRLGGSKWQGKSLQPAVHGSGAAWREVPRRKSEEECRPDFHESREPAHGNGGLRRLGTPDRIDAVALEPRNTAVDPPWAASRRGTGRIEVGDGPGGAGVRVRFARSLDSPYTFPLSLSEP